MFIKKHFRNRILLISTIFNIVRSKNVLRHASKEPIWLEEKVLENLYQKYYHQRNKTQNSNLNKNLDKTIRKAKLINDYIKRNREIQNLLEIGCGNGLVSYFLQDMGYTVTAVDITSKRLNEKVTQSKVNFIETDATHLPFEDEQFDLVFSFNAFEHFRDPESVLRETIRVVRTGGYIELLFNPLYMSPWGLHAQLAIPIPYCQFLFSKELLQNFVESHFLPVINFTGVNEWLLKDYRKLWEKYSSVLRKIHYLEIYETRHLDIILKYPSCFKAKNEEFEEFIVSGISVVFKKI